MHAKLKNHIFDYDNEWGKYQNLSKLQEIIDELNGIFHQSFIDNLDHVREGLLQF